MWSAEFDTMTSKELLLSIIKFYNIYIYMYIKFTMFH